MLFIVPGAVGRLLIANQTEAAHFEPLCDVLQSAALHLTASSDGLAVTCSMRKRLVFSHQCPHVLEELFYTRHGLSDSAWQYCTGISVSRTLVLVFGRSLRPEIVLMRSQRGHCFDPEACQAV
jgi:hypothetical protein